MFRYKIGRCKCHVTEWTCDANKVERQAHPGDRIQLYRGVYEYWAVYYGDGKVIHRTRNGAPKNFDTYARSSDKAIIDMGRLKKIAANCRMRINNVKDHLFTPRPTDEIVKMARNSVGDIVYGIYENNCEYFANECRYGEEHRDDSEREYLAGSASFETVWWMRRRLPRFLGRMLFIGMCDSIYVIGD